MKTIDYWFTPVSPWAYLGHERLRAVAGAAGAAIRVRPVDLGGRVFPVSGGLPLAKRAPQRQAYRLVELKRWSEFLGAPIVLQPRHFPVSPDDAAQLIIATDLHDGGDAAMAISGAILRAVWVEDRNVADPLVLQALLAENGLPARRLDDAH
ncbi:MAG TPA: DsbA family protein, partial [Geminicoccaceae bacterium]